jgi:hypothetical protein
MVRQVFCGGYRELLVAWLGGFWKGVFNSEVGGRYSGSMRAKVGAQKACSALTQRSGYAKVDSAVGWVPLFHWLPFVARSARGCEQ